LEFGFPGLGRLIFALFPAEFGEMGTKFSGIFSESVKGGEK